ncbi:MAG: HAD family hydrolase [Epulopiscium sp.]|nr:HAD family hydrolase [Candidatus Epulonipiscium sp.]
MFKEHDIILFDLDGTLTDPKLGITKSIQYSLKHFGINESCLDRLVPFIGPPLKDSFMEFYDFTEEQTEEAIKKYREYFAEKGLYENAIYPGIYELLEELYNGGKFLYVATSKPTIFAKKILEHFGISRFFKSIVGSNLDGSRVDKGEIISDVIENIDNPNYNKIVMIGDRKFDIIGARKLGLDSIGVLYGFGPLEELELEKPTYIAETVEDLKRNLI